MAFISPLLNLTKRLYPTGRVFGIPLDSVIEKVHIALNKSEADAANGALDILKTILPDNPFFTEQDATDWERRLAIRTRDGALLSDRKLAIQQKYATPSTIPARQHQQYLQGQLQAAGFSVYVHENRTPDGSGGWETIPIGAITGANFGSISFGSTNFGSGIDTLDIIANYVDVDRDNDFVLPDDVSATFFVGGMVLGSSATVDSTRIEEFRQLILSIKPVNTVAILLITYVPHEELINDADGNALLDAGGEFIAGLVF